MVILQTVLLKAFNFFSIKVQNKAFLIKAIWFLYNWLSLKQFLVVFTTKINFSCKIRVKTTNYVLASRLSRIYSGSAYKTPIRIYALTINTSSCIFALKDNLLLKSSIQKPALLNRVLSGKFNRAGIQHFIHKSITWVIKNIAAKSTNLTIKVKI